MALTTGDAAEVAVSETKKIDVCSCCGTKARYDSVDEAWYCPACRVWLEDRCKDPDSFICRERAERPPAGEAE